jgi:putative NADH-flavin reductase
MRIAVIGATGNVGTRIVDEALSRGHTVTAIARRAAKFASDKDLVFVAADVAEPEQLAASLKSHDAVVSSVGFRVSGRVTHLGA